MDRSIYLTKLNELKELMNAAGSSPFFAYAKVVTLVNMNMRWEKYAFNSDTSSKHPYEQARQIADEAINQFEILSDISFIEADAKSLKVTKPQEKEYKHQELFNEIWNRYDEKSFQQYID
ncbi:MAG TPA: hypothetical protein VN426_00075, partial [Syntrophomonadaceae bacterium]|nr:hypothetical protein [Syntrophomonadaceae bacterium]